MSNIYFNLAEIVAEKRDVIFLRQMRKNCMRSSRP